MLLDVFQILRGISENDFFSNIHDKIERNNWIHGKNQ